VPRWIDTYDVIVDDELVLPKSKVGQVHSLGEVVSMGKGLQESAADSHS
jgi:hypothetical protein